MQVSYVKCCKLSDQLESALTVLMELVPEKARKNFVEPVQVSTEYLMVVAESLDL